MEELELAPLEQTLIDHKKLGKPWINLIDSSFHKNGFFPDQKILAETANQYFNHRVYEPDSLGDEVARNAISQYYQKRQVAISPSDILITASSSESYSLIFNQLGDPGDRVLLPLPGYPLFESLAEYHSLIPDFYPLDPEQEWQPDLEVLESLIEPETRFLLLISPNNPTGSVLSESLYTQIMMIAHNHSLLVIHDEVFSEYVWNSDSTSKAGSTGMSHLIAQPSPGLPGQDHVQTPRILINGISKMCASPDLKLSWMAQFNLPKVWKNRLELANDTYLNANNLSQYLLPRLLDSSLGPEGVTEKVLRVLQENETYLFSLIHSLDHPAIQLVTPSDTSYRGGIHRVLIISDPEFFTQDEQLACKLLTDFGVYVHPASLYGYSDLFDTSCGLIVSLLKTPKEFKTGMNQLISGLEILVQTP